MTHRLQSSQAASVTPTQHPSSGRLQRVRAASAMLMACAALVACSSKPAIPAWQMNAHSSTEKALHAYLSGDSRVDQQEWVRARRELSSTGRLDLVARAELLRCAAQSASLALAQSCSGFDALRPDAAPADQTYANYLFGRTLSPDEVGLLPQAQRPLASALGQEGGTTTTTVNTAALLRAVEDPLSRLVGAGVLFRMGRAGRDVAALAVETASAQGWRRPLIAWLTVQADLAQAEGDLEAAAHARRRLSIAAP